MLAEFTGNRELVLQANNAEMLVKMIKWASTAASVVSSPASIASAGEKNNDGISVSNPVVVDNIPDIDGDDVW